MYLVAFSTTNMHVYHKLAIGHLMQAGARFALQCFSLGLVLVTMLTTIGILLTIIGIAIATRKRNYFPIMIIT